MATIAVYSSKGGVGKTTLAVNLAWCAATLSRRRTLLWDLDQQAASGWMLGCGQRGDAAATLFGPKFGDGANVTARAQRTSVDRLDIIAADPSLRTLDLLLHRLGKRRRLQKLIERAGYDHVLLDCPPGLTETRDR